MAPVGPEMLPRRDSENVGGTRIGAYTLVSKPTAVLHVAKGKGAAVATVGAGAMDNERLWWRA